VHLPKSYKFESLTNAKMLYGPLWEKMTLGVFGQCCVLECVERLYSMDLVAYEGTIYIVPARPEFAGGVFDSISVVWYYDRTVAKLIDREKWFELNNEAQRMRAYSIPRKETFPIPDAVPVPTSLIL